MLRINIIYGGNQSIVRTPKKIEILYFI